MERGHFFLFVIALLLFLYLMWQQYWRAQLMFNSSSLSSFTPESFRLDESFKRDYEQRVKEGFEYARTQKIVICGLVRDVQDVFPLIRKKVERLGAIFADYKVLLVENDSKDSTRDLLLRWRENNPRITILGCGYNVQECKLSLPATEGHSVSRSRIEKMANLRSLYLDELRKLDPDEYRYTVVWDLDIVGSVYLDGVANSMSYFKDNPKSNAFCANGIYQWGLINMYYDTYAHLDKGDSFHIDRKFVHDMTKGIGTQYSRGQPPIEVNSCFSGFTIYRTKAIAASQYDMSPEEDGNLECEHVRLHKRISGVYMNPSMIHLVIRNK